MSRMRSWHSWGVIAVLGCSGGTSTGSSGGASGAANAGVIGQPCVIADENSPDFSGFATSEVNVATSATCGSGTCVGYHFQGRSSCPYGQASTDIDTLPDTDPARCRTSNGEAVTVPVDPQLVERRAEDVVICSCRCDGPDATQEYCTCPSGFECAPLLQNIGLGGSGNTASYCIKTGTEFDPTAPPGPTCDRTQQNCEP
jgi:hypothetical protein